MSIVKRRSVQSMNKENASTDPPTKGWLMDPSEEVVHSINHNKPTLIGWSWIESLDRCVPCRNLCDSPCLRSYSLTPGLEPGHLGTWSLTRKKGTSSLPTPGVNLEHDPNTARPAHSPHTSPRTLGRAFHHRRGKLGAQAAGATLQVGLRCLLRDGHP